MALLRVKVSNFKSYENVEVEGFERLNVMVGKNGSGKSNLIAALEFCLTDRYASLNESQRREFLSSVSSIVRKTPKNLMETNVEVEINNSKKRFSIATSTITFRRRMTWKSDEYFINNRSIKFDEYMGFLDNAGFWSRNSYFIVRHGHIENIVMSDPKSLLGIIREMFGSKHFEARKKKALDSLDAARSLLAENQIKIDEARQHMEMYKFSQQDIVNFKKLTKQQRFLKGKSAHFQAENHKLEMQSIEQNLQEIIEEKEDFVDEFEDARKSYVDCDDKLQNRKREIAQLEKQFQISDRRSKTMLECISELQQRLLMLELFESNVDENSLEENSKQMEDKKLKREELKMEKNDLKNRILQCKKDSCQMIFEIDKYRMKGKYEGLSDQEFEELIRTKNAEIEAEIEKTETKIEELNDHKGVLENRYSGMKNWLETVFLSAVDYEFLKKLKLRVCHNESLMKRLKARIKAIIAENNEVSERVFKARYYISYPPSMSEFTMHQSSSFLRNPLRKLLNEIGMSISYNSFSDEQQKYDYQTIHEGYHGQIVEHLVLPSSFHQTLEALLGEKIFAYVVSNRTVAAKILKLLKLRGWNVPAIQLLALDSVHIEPEIFTDPTGTAVSFLNCIDLSKITSPVIENSIKYICQKKYVVQTLEDAAKFHLKYPTCHFATINGISYKGNGRVGVVKSDAKTKFELFQEKKLIQDEVTALYEKNVERDEELVRAEFELKNVIHQYESDLEFLKENEERLKSREIVGKLSQKLIEFPKLISNTNELIDFYTILMDKLKVEKIFWNDFRTKGFVFPDDDSVRMNSCLQRLREIKGIEDSVSKSIILNEGSSSENDKMLEILEGKRKNIQERLIEEELNKHVQLESQQDMERLQEESEKIRSECEVLNERINHLKGSFNILKREHEDLKLQFGNLTLKMNEINERLNQTKVMHEKCKLRYQQAKEEANQIGYNHGVPVSGIPDNYFNANFSELIRFLRQVDREIEKVSAAKINSETIRLSEEVYQNLNELKDSKQKQELTIAAILTLIEKIVKKRSDIILRNIQQLGVYFEAYFKHFVPNGHAKIVLSVREENEEDESSQSTPIESLSQGSRNILHRIERNDDLHDNFDELDIMVSFGGTDSYQKMESLSGGQRTVIAITFVFAVQTIIDLPFHLFDELDRNLDLRNRTALAAFVRKQAIEKGHQYVFATHYPEFVNVSDNIYGISIAGGISNLTGITHEQAKDFLEGNIEEEMTVPEINDENSF